MNYKKCICKHGRTRRYRYHSKQCSQVRSTNRLTISNMYPFRSEVKDLTTANISIFLPIFLPVSPHHYLLHLTKHYFYVVFELIQLNRTDIECAMVYYIFQQSHFRYKKADILDLRYADLVRESIGSAIFT